MSTGAVIVHYMNWPEVIDTVRDVLAQGIDAQMLWVIDNGSEPPLRAELEEIFPGITVLDAQGNVGYGAAVNIGVAAAAQRGAERALVCTHEVRMPLGTLTQLERALDENAGVSVAAPVVYRKSDPMTIWSAGGELSRSLWPSARPMWRADPPDWIDGCCYLLDVDVFDAIGGMYEPYFLYMEEVDFFVRMRRTGHAISVVEAATAYQNPGSMNLYYATRNRILLSRRVGSHLRTAAIVMNATLRLFLEATVFRAARQQKVLMRARGIRDGIRTPAR